MRTEIREMKFDAWRHGLLDISKRNKLINYRKTKRATLQVTYPSLYDLYRRLVADGVSLSFRKQIDAGDDLHLSQLFYIMDKMNAAVELAEGEVRSNLSTLEMNQTLKNLRAKARLSQEEQGINILYLSFGFLQWHQKPTDPYILSPLVLVPICLEVESILSPYTMKRLEEDIVVNPTLEYALSSEYGITLPEFDPMNDDIEAFLDRVNAAVTKSGWAVLKETNIGLLSFLKIIMYKDLEKYKDRIFANPVIQAFCGDASALKPIDDALRQFPHDKTPAIDVCQVVNADASQQDAILLSRNGASFVLQGPPGTGKSQTITNIIAQALADKKKVLFVSEKMAALSVVDRRLSEVGLADYCLSLHNYKAERRVVIQDLVNTLDAPTKSVKAGVTDALTILEEERAQLNSYIDEINKLRAPLNRTIFEVITELVALEDAGVYQIEDDIDQTTEKEFASRISVLRWLSDFLEHYKGDIFENPWRDSTISIVTYDIRNTITNHLSALTGFLFGLSSSLSYLNQKSETDKQWSLNDFYQLVQQLIMALLIDKTQIGLNTAVGSALFSKKSINALENAYRGLSDANDQALSVGLHSDALFDRASLENTHAALLDMKAHLERASALISALTQSTSINLAHDYTGLAQGKALLSALSIRHAVLPNWFIDGKFDAIKKYVYTWKEMADKATEIKRSIDANWESGFYNLDYTTLIARFTGEYTSFFKRLGKQYRGDKAVLVSMRKAHPSKLDDSECVSGLNLLKNYTEALEQYMTATREAASVIGAYYKQMDTDWEELTQILNDCAPADNYFNQHGVSDELITHLEKPFYERMQTILPPLNINTVENAIDAFDCESIALTEVHISYITHIDAVNKQIASVERYLSAYSACGATIETFFAKNMKAPQATAELLASCKALSNMILRAAYLRRKAKTYFKGIGFTLDSDLLNELSELYEDYFNNQTIEATTEKLCALYTSQDAELFCKCINTAPECEIPHDQAALLKTFASWFPNIDCHAMPIQALSERVGKCQDIESLQSWMRYADLVRECSQRGLDGYLSFIEDKRIAPNQIIPIYRKSFLTKWLLNLLVRKDIPNLKNFQSYAHEKIIDDFSVNDGKQLQIAQARLVDWLSHEKPSGITQLASAMDEVTLLRREAEKKRRIIPLRRLFKTIPTLLTKLKPCFMMSPLSVSYFLDSDMYSFDLVIFDEASQILPEDAIGVIYRGKQAIIAGDTKQMPPTNFFSVAAKNTDEYDIDEDSDEYYADIVSESILDEAAACLPSCTLLWHYRSKDESLISFSNQQLYNNNLITFPNCFRLEDRGLEYVYVPNGYYEGSGKNCNVMEARKCLALLIEHIKKHPNRSLGIVAFSEKQQGVIEDVINDFRLKNRQYEHFFDESKDEPFFVKNLENVQGDERDTIIFSICYAKNTQGRMYQRFGPLGHDGGERRLNVAITRAKYNVKLVGSIMPTDIVVNEGTKDGIRMLREYIYYAMQNDYGVPTGGISAIDEPFADQIASFLSANGYNVKRNIGTSQYKVDIAVEKSGYPDILMAGIECDGYNYTNTRTARDRDVLRRSVMKELGWRLYHIWSMAWYLNPEDEKRRLLEFLHKCDATSISKQVVRHSSADKQPEEDEHNALVTVEELTDSEDCSTDTHTIVFEPYEYSDPSEAEYQYGDDNYTNLSRRIMWVMQREQPIHKEELYRRLATVFGNSKVTAPVRRTIDDCINRRLLSEITVSGDFLYLKGAPIVARAPKNNEEPRSIEYIAPEELQDAMREILTIAYGLTPKDLISETARQLGYARTGPRINAVLEDNYRAMLARGKIKDSDGKLYCVEEND